MNKTIIALILLCVSFSHTHTMQQLVRISKRCMSNKISPNKIDKVANKVIKKMRIPKSQSVGITKPSRRFTYDLLKAIAREQKNTQDMFVLEEKTFAVLSLISVMKNEKEMRICAYPKKENFFSARLKISKEDK